MSVTSTLDVLQIQALNGGPEFTFTEAISLLVSAVGQDEIDHLWDRLTSSGEPRQCGWLKDKYALSWQIVPPILNERLGDPDADKSSRVLRAMLGMGKIDIAALRAAYDGDEWTRCTVAWWRAWIGARVGPVHHCAAAGGARAAAGRRGAGHQGHHPHPS